VTLALLVTTGLVFARLAGAVMVLPGMAVDGVPKLVRLAIAVSLTVLIAPTAPVADVVPTLPLLVSAMVSEVVLGLLLGGAVGLVFGGLVFATEIIGSQTGRLAALQFNPLLKMSQDPIGILAGMMALLVFMGMNLHLAVLLILAESFQTVHPGHVVGLLDVAGMWVELAGPTLKIGLRLAGPVLALVFLVNCFVAVLARLAPSMNVFFSIGFILTSLAGLGLMILLLPQLMEQHLEAIAWVIDLLPELVRAAGGGHG
jgi:flagellar biosynthetic protein FliR